MVLKRILNNESVSISDIPVVRYEDFYAQVTALFKNKSNHCSSYFAYVFEGKLKFICCIASDVARDIILLSHEQSLANEVPLQSISAKVMAFHIFEREIHENFGVAFKNHPFLKPVRYAHNRADQTKNFNNYPFFKIGGQYTHEVGVGPIHAGVIEPGHFRFSCQGENVKHLEIHLGYQHRGLEQLMLSKKHLLQRTVLAESISGDSAVAQTIAFASIMETLYETPRSQRVDMLRTLALELERIAVHVGDLGNISLDIAYQLGSAVFGVLRTPVINYFQAWCGNRFGKGLIRVGYNPFPFTSELQEKLFKMLEEFDIKYMEMQSHFLETPSVLNRIEKCGDVSTAQMELLGGVGMAARASGLKRDVRETHPFCYFKELSFESKTVSTGDVYARTIIRNIEIQDSLAYIRSMLTQIYKLVNDEPKAPRFDLYEKKMLSNRLCISLVEGWRGEICHVAITNNHGELLHYKIKEPSMHNWTALSLALRNNEISDFPVNNKSFDLSYCGHDL